MRNRPEGRIRVYACVCVRGKKRLMMISRLRADSNKRWMETYGCSRVERNKMLVVTSRFFRGKLKQDADGDLRGCSRI